MVDKLIFGLVGSYAAFVIAAAIAEGKIVELVIGTLLVLPFAYSMLKR